MTPQVSVIVPVRNGAHVIGGLLDALAGQRGAPPYDVIVVDNASTDATGQVARDHPLQPHVVGEPRPGSYAARNAGIRHARGRVLAFTDADCLPDPGWLAAGVAALATAEVVGGRVDVQRSPRPRVWERLDAGHYLDQRRNVEQQGFTATANAFVRREAMDRLGGFDPALRSGGDRELCRRALAAGMRLAYAHDALVLHRPRTTLRDTWALNRRIGYSLRDLHVRGMHPAWYADQQMVLSPRWARGTSSDATVRTSAPAAIAVWLTVIAARWVGRVTGR